MTYEFNGEKYKKSSTHQKEWGNKIINELKISKNAKILDLGCGDGTITLELAKKAPQGFVLGIDASTGILDMAKQNEIKNLAFEKMDINHLTLSDKFDLIFSNATLHWIKDHIKLWKSIYPLLNNKGIIRFNFAADGNCASFFKIIKKIIQKTEYVQFFKEFEWSWFMPEIKKYQNIIKEVSFLNIDIWEENADRFFPNEESLIGWIDQPSIVPFLKHIPGNKLKKQFRNTVVEAMIKKTKQKDNKYFETFRRINVMAKR